MCAVRQNKMIEIIEKVKFLSGFGRSVSLFLIRSESVAYERFLLPAFTSSLPHSNAYTNLKIWKKKSHVRCNPSVDVRDLDFIKLRQFYTANRSIKNHIRYCTISCGRHKKKNKMHKSNNNFINSIDWCRQPAACYAPSLRSVHTIFIHIVLRMDESFGGARPSTKVY